MEVLDVECLTEVVEHPGSQAEPVEAVAGLEQEAAEFICRQVLERGATLFDG